MQHYQILPYAASVALAFYLPFLEIVCAAALWSRRWERGALALLSAMTLVFIAALASAWMRGLNIHCGCFGSETAGKAAIATAIGRDMLILAGLAILWWADGGARRKAKE